MIRQSFQRLASSSFAICYVVAIAFWLSPPRCVTAQVNPQSGSTAVTVGVPDSIAPSTPLLIAPTDGNTIVDNTPLFVWSAATDNVAVTSYQLHLDGSLLFNTIPTTATTTSTYTLLYDGSSSSYSLTPTTVLTDGSHTWKITAFDSAGNQTSSVTWSFTIDTQAPHFLITTIGDQIVSISAQDSATLPVTAIELTDNEPYLSGTGEANSSVLLHVYLESDASETDQLEFVIGSDGNWVVQLNTLERDVNYLLTFEITDQAGLLSILEDVPLLIKGYEIVIEPPDIFPPTDEPIVIPIDIVPTEVVSKLLHVVQLQLKEVVSTTLVSNAHSSTKLLSPLWYTQLLVLLAVVLLPLIKFVLLAAPFGKEFSVPITLVIIRAIIGVGDTQSDSLIVADDTQQAKPFITIQVITAPSQQQTTPSSCIGYLMSDERGYLPPLPRVNEVVILKASLDHEPIFFPKYRPAHLSEIDWYRGQTLQLHADKLHTALVIPVSVSTSTAGRSRVKQWLLARPIDSITVLSLAVLVLIITPTIGNYLVTLLYGGHWIWKSWRNRQTNTLIAVTDSTKQMVPFSVIRTVNIDDRAKLNLLLHTNKQGEVAKRLNFGRYDCHAVHHSYRQRAAATIDVASHTETVMIIPVLSTTI